MVDQVDNVDAMSLAIYNGPDEKRLYYGLTRQPMIHSIALDEAGNFAGEPRPEYSYAVETVGGPDTARRIRFGQSPQMTLHLLDFNYSLQVASETLEDTVYFQQNLESGEWTSKQ